MQPARLYFTLKDLRWQQFYYRLWYGVKRRHYTVAAVADAAIEPALRCPQCALFVLPVFDKYDPNQKRFLLLNQQQDFPGKIEWNTVRHGMLWAYHLNYFGWLEDESITVNVRLATLKDYCAAAEDIRIGLESYPISLRGMAIIRFCLRHKINDPSVLKQTYQHYQRLYQFPEYQIQGNHLWQNACSLICAGYFFKSNAFYNKGRQLLNKELSKQILNDGGHIEGSPMYHSALLSALLQTIEIAIALNADDNAFIEKMSAKAALMLGWLEQITFSNGEWPQVNDTTGGIAPNLALLIAYAASLKINSSPKKLQDSGYRMYRNDVYELFVDAGSIQPVWQPGHAHSDELSFCLNVGNQPVIIDPAISTYEAGESRNQQRSTMAHNTVCVGGKSASDVWKSFRVGKKAKVSIIEENKDNIFLECITNHTSYTRKFILKKDIITIIDNLKSYNNEPVSINFHFAKNIVLKKINNCEFLAGNLQISIEGNIGAEIETYYLSEEFNQQVPAQRLHLQTGKHTITRLQILNAD